MLCCVQPTKNYKYYSCTPTGFRYSYRNNKTCNETVDL